MLNTDKLNEDGIIALIKKYLEKMKNEGNGSRKGMLQENRQMRRKAITKALTRMLLRLLGQKQEAEMQYSAVIPNK